jgi:5-methylcytosine-specific restriction endonuclease McrA
MDSWRAGESKSARRKRRKREKKAKLARQMRYAPKAPTVKIGAVDVQSKDFLATYEWRVVRMQALKKYGPRCQCCGATPATGAVMNVDHIKPRKTHPQLALSLDNLQILCDACNHGKGNWDETDWRGQIVDVGDLEPEQRAHLASI